MKRGIFSRFYDWMLRASQRPDAQWWLGAVSFADASFLPIIPDVLLAPMVMARRERWLWLATLTTVTSVIGGAAGYAIGHYLIHWVMPVLDRVGWRPQYEATVRWFAVWGVWVVIAKGLTPVPYKILTITAGAVHMPILPFMVASAVSRSMRFFLVAGIFRWAGPALQRSLPRYIELIGWGIVAIVMAIVLAHTL